MKFASFILPFLPLFTGGPTGAGAEELPETHFRAASNGDRKLKSTSETSHPHLGSSNTTSDSASSDATSDSGGSEATSDSEQEFTVNGCDDVVGLDDSYFETVHWLAELRDDCLLGYINSTDDFSIAVEEYQNPAPTLSVEEQVAQMANHTCSAVNQTELDQEIVDACLEDPRDDQSVLDALVRVEFAKNDETELLPGLEQSCIDLAKNRDSIYADLEVLKERDSGRRRLEESDHITSFGYAVEMIDMYECFCDESNPMNNGCSLLFLRFLEDTMKAVDRQAELMAQMSDSDVIGRLEESLDKHTTHLRNSNPPDYQITQDDANALAERALADVNADAGGCDPPGLQRNIQGGFSLCMYAGPYLECGISTSQYSPTCISGSCGAGAAVRLVTEVQLCGGTRFDNPTISLELKICVDVISDVLDVIQNRISVVNSMLNSLNIYGGCYRLAWAQYNFRYQRMEVQIPVHEVSYLGVLRAGAGGNARVRFKSHGTHYQDSMAWYCSDWLANNNNGLVRNTGGTTCQNQWSSARSRRYFSIGRYVNMSVTFRVRVFIPISCSCHWRGWSLRCSCRAAYWHNIFERSQAFILK